MDFSFECDSIKSLDQQIEIISGPFKRIRHNFGSFKRFGEETKQKYLYLLAFHVQFSAPVCQPFAICSNVAELNMDSEIEMFQGERIVCIIDKDLINKCEKKSGG